MLGYLDTGACRMEYLRRELDDPRAEPCGRCDNCTGRPWAATVSEGLAIMAAYVAVFLPLSAYLYQRKESTG